MGVKWGGFSKAWHQEFPCRAFFFRFRYALYSMHYAFFWVSIMNSYLVRIYRKAEDNPRMLIGVVEEVGKKEKKAFHSLNELWDILNQKKELKNRKTSFPSKRGITGIREESGF